jgi:ABC-type antimicrobial peptide transport system permease subunit
MALGASREVVLSELMREAALLILTGLFCGFACSFLVTRAISAQLYGVGPTDPGTLLAVMSLIIAVGLIAAYIPSRRAMAVDPVVALRHE